MSALKIFISACSVCLMMLASNATAQQTNDLIAIDIVIEPDAAMIDKAKAANARLRQNYPQGYELDAAHAPHISMVQRFRARP